MNSPLQGRPLRVLVIAEMCNPTWTSVPLVGYNMARALSEHPDLQVTVVTHIRNYEALRNDPIQQRADVVYLDNEWLARPAYQLARRIRGGDKLAWTIETAMMWPSYIVFEFLLHSYFAKDFDAGRFDLIHRVTPLTPTIPSPLAARTHVPMVIGPLNGGLPWPKEYPDLRIQEKEWLVPFRRIYSMLPFHRQMYHNLAGVIAGSKHTASEIPSFYNGKRFYMPENGVDPKRFPLAASWPKPNGPFQFITIGRLVPYKGTDLTIEALAASSILRQTRLLICGDGPFRGDLEAQVKRHGLTDQVQFLGWLDHKAVSQQLGQSQSFVFPSLREFGGGVVVEAMSAAVPPIIVNYGGPAELVTPESGMLIPLQPRNQLIQDLRTAMETLVTRPDLCQQLGQQAVQQVRTNYLWSAKAETIVGYYRQILETSENHRLSSRHFSHR